ncbi:hypothetical protein [Bacillus sp. EB01]|uniref:hypothetical protein n=1 Tax=Bacillus sp. EB01 TaxID=1347086 RepID=UPI000B142FE3|nr:hypothetical protein [Bacillus sp. EB01]
MLCILGSVAFLIISVIVFKHSGVTNPFSKGVGIAIGISLLAAVCLAQNYSHSLVPGIEDGIAISNMVSYWIIGEDGWSKVLFKQWFEGFTIISLLFIISYPIVLTFESRMGRKIA